MGNYWSPISPNIPDGEMAVIPNRVVNRDRQGDVYLVMFSAGSTLKEEDRVKRSHHALVLDLAGESDDTKIKYVALRNIVGYTLIPCFQGRDDSLDRRRQDDDDAEGIQTH